LAQKSGGILKCRISPVQPRCRSTRR
jgi:hypothetical protein